jgi:hypothetical protein
MLKYNFPIFYLIFNFNNVHVAFPLALEYWDKNMLQAFLWNEIDIFKVNDSVFLGLIRISSMVLLLVKNIYIYIYIPPVPVHPQ